MNLLAHNSLGIDNGCIPCENISSLWQLLGIFLFLVLMVYVYHRLKASVPRLKAKGKLGRKLEVLETKPLGNRQFLLVVSYEKDKFLLGVHPNGMQFLSKLPNSEKLK